MFFKVVGGSLHKTAHIKDFAQTLKYTSPDSNKFQSSDTIHSNYSISCKLFVHSLQLFEEVGSISIIA